MKKIILVLFFITGIAFAQDVTSSMNVYLRDTLTSTIDSIRVDVNANNQNNIFTITVYTTSGTDTVNVYTLPKGYTVWSQKSLIDLSTTNIVTQLVATTTAKEYLLTEPEVTSLMLVTPDVTASTVFIVSRKSGAYSINGITTTAETSLDNIEADADSIVDKVTEIDNNTDLVEAKLDSIDASTTRIEGYTDGIEGLITTSNVKLDSLDASSTRQETKLDNIKTSVDSVDASLTRNEAKLDLVNTSLDNIESDADAIRVATEIIDNAISGNEMQVDIVAELPAGTNLLGSVGIDQTIDGTTNKVRAFQPTHDNFQANVNLQVGDADVTNLNPVPMSDAGGSLTVDNNGTFAVQSTPVGSSNNYGEERTTVAALDSVSFGFTSKEYTFVNDGTISDTLYISPSSSFPTTNTEKRIGGEWITKRHAATKLYFKIGATPLASKKIRIEAN